MTAELQALLDTLTGKHAWLTAGIAWIGVLRLFCKWFSARLQSAVEHRITAALASKSAEQIQRTQTILNSRSYAWAAFTLDLLFSIKLPVALNLEPEP